MIAQEDIKIGAKVVFNYEGDWGDHNAINGNEYYIVEDSHSNESQFFTKHTVELFAVQVNEECFTLVTNEQSKEVELPLSKTVYDIARPVLSERKLGKVKMQLFDEGFPNAVMEIARVMTWAEKHKGYKPNDFKSLPNADVEFPAAASRHRVKGFIQKAEGVAPIDRVDDESGIVHLAHAAFNVLAELELVLTNKIK